MKTENPREGAKQPHGARATPYAGLLASAPMRKRASNAKAGSFSLVFHALLVGGLVWLTMKAGVAVTHPQQPTIVDLVSQVIPPPPKASPPPKLQAPKGFQTLMNPTVVSTVIPPPSLTYPHYTAADFTGRGVEGGTGAGDSTQANQAPPFTPFTVAPFLVNPGQVNDALLRNYPPVLQDAGLGGTVNVWIHLDAKGHVEEVRVHLTSGYPAFDSAAVKVGKLMRFKPALNRDQTVPVWVSIPITFQVQH